MFTHSHVTWPAPSSNLPFGLSGLVSQARAPTEVGMRDSKQPSTPAVPRRGGARFVRVGEALVVAAAMVLTATPTTAAAAGDLP